MNSSWPTLPPSLFLFPFLLLSSLFSPLLFPFHISGYTEDLGRSKWAKETRWNDLEISCLQLLVWMSVIFHSEKIYDALKLDGYHNILTLQWALLIAFLGQIFHGGVSTYSVILSLPGMPMLMHTVFFATLKTELSSNYAWQQSCICSVLPWGKAGFMERVGKNLLFFTVPFLTEWKSKEMVIYRNFLKVEMFPPGRNHISRTDESCKTHWNPFLWL